MTPEAARLQLQETVQEVSRTVPETMLNMHMRFSDQRRVLNGRAANVAAFNREVVRIENRQLKNISRTETKQEDHEVARKSPTDDFTGL